MTTIVETRNDTVIVSMVGSDGTNFSGIHQGQFWSRNSAGQDRPVGSRPGMISYRQSYSTKPFIWRGIVVRPSESRVRIIHKPDPHYPGYEVPHAYVATYINLTCGNALATKNLFGNWTNEGNSFNLELGSVADPFTVADQNALIGQLRTKVAGSNFNAAVFLGEAPRSLKMIAESTSQVYKAYRSIRRGQPLEAVSALFGAGRSIVTKVSRGKGPKSNFINGREVLTYSVAPPRGPKFLVQESKEAAASNWLALQYGWKPLLGDIHDAAVFIDHQLRRPCSYRVTALRFANGARLGAFVNVALGGGRPVWIQHRNVSSTRIVAHFTEIDVPRLTGIMNPETVAWELVPFSFVVDWFIPIGNYLDNRALNQALKGSYVTTRKHVVSSADGKVVTSRTIDSKLNYKGGNQSRMVKITRTLSNDIPNHLPNVVPLSKAFSWTRAANAVALMVGLNSSR